MPDIETSDLVVLAADRFITQSIRDSDGEITTAPWVVSAPIPGIRLINAWQIYQLIWVVLVQAENGHYQIFRSIDRINFSLVHDHETEIYNLFWIDDGHMLFCATDGWWATTSSGMTWLQLWYDPHLPAHALATMEALDHWKLIAYGDDNKLYETEYTFSFHPASAVPEYDSWDDVPVTSTEPDPLEVVPEYDSWDDVPVFADLDTGDVWDEVYDTSALWGGKICHAVAESPSGFLVGVGPYLIRAAFADLTTWEVLHTVDGIIKEVQATDRSNLPLLIITVDTPTGDQIYTSTDNGDSISHSITRDASPGIVIESIVPTGQNAQEISYTVVGRRASGEIVKFKSFQG